MIAAVTSRESPGRNGNRTPGLDEDQQRDPGEDVRAEGVQDGRRVEQAHGQRKGGEHDVPFTRCRAGAVVTRTDGDTADRVRR